MILETLNTRFISFSLYQMLKAFVIVLYWHGIFTQNVYAYNKRITVLLLVWRAHFTALKHMHITRGLISDIYILDNMLKRCIYIVQIIK